jgi:uncharacterized protein
LLGVGNRNELLSHPKVGASWEGFVIDQLLQMDLGDPWFWATHGGAEIDLIARVGVERIGLEVKRTDQPHMTPSIRHALDDLDLDRVLVIHAGERSYPMTDKVGALSARALLSQGLGGDLTH